MPAVSEKQRRLMGMALAFKRGEAKTASPEVRRLVAQMTEEQLRDFASSPEESQPERAPRRLALRKGEPLDALLEMSPARVFSVLERGAFPELRKGLSEWEREQAAVGCRVLGVIPPAWLCKGRVWVQAHTRRKPKGGVARVGAHWREVEVGEGQQPVSFRRHTAGTWHMRVHPEVEAATGLTQKVRDALGPLAREHPEGGLIVPDDVTERGKVTEARLSAARKLVREHVKMTSPEEEERKAREKRQAERARKDPETGLLQSAVHADEEARRRKAQEATPPAEREEFYFSEAYPLWNDAFRAMLRRITPYLRAEAYKMTGGAGKRFTLTIDAERAAREEVILHKQEAARLQEEAANLHAEEAGLAALEEPSQEQRDRLGAVRARLGDLEGVPEESAPGEVATAERAARANLAAATRAREALEREEATLKARVSRLKTQKPSAHRDAKLAEAEARLTQVGGRSGELARAKRSEARVAKEGKAESKRLRARVEELEGQRASWLLSDAHREAGEALEKLRAEAAEARATVAASNGSDNASRSRRAVAASRLADLEGRAGVPGEVARAEERLASLGAAPDTSGLTERGALDAELIRLRGRRRAASKGKIAEALHAADLARRARADLYPEDALELLTRTEDRMWERFSSFGRDEQHQNRDYGALIGWARSVMRSQFQELRDENEPLKDRLERLSRRFISERDDTPKTEEGEIDWERARTESMWTPQPQPGREMEQAADEAVVHRAIARIPDEEARLAFGHAYREGGEWAQAGADVDAALAEALSRRLGRAVSPAEAAALRVRGFRALSRDEEFTAYMREHMSAAYGRSERARQAANAAEVEALARGGDAEASVAGAVGAVAGRVSSKGRKHLEGLLEAAEGVVRTHADAEERWRSEAKARRARRKELRASLEGAAERAKTAEGRRENTRAEAELKVLEARRGPGSIGQAEHAQSREHGKAEDARRRASVVQTALSGDLEAARALGAEIQEARARARERQASAPTSETSGAARRRRLVLPKGKG